MLQTALLVDAKANNHDFRLPRATQFANVRVMTDGQVNHPSLVEAAARWLRRKCAVVITELSTTGETPDAIGWQGTHSTLIECKTSRADFMADRKKPFRCEHWQGVGNKRYFMTAPGVIELEELPDKWGLLELTDDGCIRALRVSEQFQEANHRHEIGILLSALRRIGHNAPTGVSIRCYMIETKNCATLGVLVLDGETTTAP